MAGILVTGTDTGVGKTVVACAIAATLVERDVRVAAWKPIETGIDPGAEESSDAALLARAARTDAPPESACTYRLRAPLAPAVAARLEGVVIDIARLERAYRRHADRADVVVIEGAGGLLVPLEGRLTYADLARRLDVPILIVAANRLGTINHTALTVRVAAAEGVRVAGFVLNDLLGPQVRTTVPAAAPSAAASSAAGSLAAGSLAAGSCAGDLSRPTNRDAIVELTGVSCLGKLPYLPDLADLLRSSPARLGRYLDIDSVLREATRGARA
jgi:dethiobiotin synthetase